MIFIFYLIVLNVKLSLEGNYFFTSRLNSLGSYCMMGYVTPFQYNGIFTIELQNEMSFTTNENIANNCVLDFEYNQKSQKIPQKQFARCLVSTKKRELKK